MSTSSSRVSHDRLHKERNCHPEFRLGGTKDLEIPVLFSSFRHTELSDRINRRLFRYCVCTNPTNHSGRRIRTRHIVADLGIRKTLPVKDWGTGMAPRIEKRKYPQVAKPHEIAVFYTICATIGSSDHGLVTTGGVVWSNNHDSADEITLRSIGMRFLAISYSNKGARRKEGALWKIDGHA